MQDLWRLSAADLAALVKSKKISAKEAAVSALARLDAVNPKLNAVVDYRVDDVLNQASLVDATIAGDDEPVATMDRPWYTDALAADTAPDMLRAYVSGTTSVLERVAPIGRVLEAAVASDPEVAALWPHDVDPRYVVQRNAAEALAARPGARVDVPVEEMADLLYGLLSPELYLLFVRERGWTRERWEQWVSEALRTQLCSMNGDEHEGVRNEITKERRL